MYSPQTVFIDTDSIGKNNSNVWDDGCHVIYFVEGFVINCKWKVSSTQQQRYRMLS